MTDTEKAKIILEKLDSVMGINWNMEKMYIGVIREALKEIANSEDVERMKELEEKRDNGDISEREESELNYLIWKFTNPLN